MLLCNYRDVIERATLEGNYREVVIDVTVAPNGIAIFGHYIFWTDHALSKYNEF